MSVADAPPEPNLFAELDVDPKDGKLSPAEILKHFQKQDPSMTELPNGLMEQEDKDKVSPAPSKRFPYGHTSVCLPVTQLMIRPDT